MNIQDDSSTNNNIIATTRGMKTFKGNDPSAFQHWLQKISLILSFQRPDIFDIMEGKERPVVHGDRTEDVTDQTAFDKANQDLYAILFLVTEKPASLLVAKHAQDIRGTRGNGQAALQELEAKYLKITNETIRATQEALAATRMEDGQDPDEYINEATRLRELLKEMEEPITDRRFMDIILQGLTNEYRDVKLMTWKDPEFDLPKMQPVLRHLYLDEVSRKKNPFGRPNTAAVMTAASTPEHAVVICHRCGMAGHYKVGCAMPAKTGEKTSNSGKKHASGGGGKKWCSVHRSTTHSDEECYKQQEKQHGATASFAATTDNEKAAIDFTMDVNEFANEGFMF